LRRIFLTFSLKVPQYFEFLWIIFSWRGRCMLPRSQWNI
jgi:hypothetical protein